MRSSRTKQRHVRLQKFREQGVGSAFQGVSTAAVTLATVEHGRSVFVARFAACGDMPSHDVRLGGLDPDLPIAPLLRNAFVTAACGLNSIHSRRSLWTSLRSGFLRFLDDAGDKVIIFDERLVARFVNWLNRSVPDKGLLSLRSRRTYYVALMKVLKAGAEARVPGLEDLQLDWRSSPWIGQHASLPAQKAFLSQSEMTTILRACRADVESVTAATASDLDDFLEGRMTNPVIVEAERLRSAFADMRRRSVRCHLSDLDRMASDDAIGVAAVRLLTPTFTDLMPFILLLAHYTGFNQSTLLGVEVRHIRRVRLGDARWTIVESYKRRSDSVQRAKFSYDNTSTNPARLLEIVERWTHTLRQWSSSQDLWIVRTADDIRRLGDPTVRIGLTTRVRDWLSKKNLPYTNIGAIRKGILDLAHLASGGDEDAVRGIRGQRSPDVIAKHYTSPAARKRDRERLASAVQELERLIGSEGRIDARRLPDTSDRSSATPGFLCVDRHASPIPGEVPGRSCQSYGHCPICPLALVDVSSPRSCGYLHLLDDRIGSGLEGNSAASAANYIAIWLPILRRLRSHWLPAFSDEVRTAAKLLTLVTLPEVE